MAISVRAEDMYKYGAVLGGFCLGGGIEIGETIMVIFGIVLSFLSINGALDWSKKYRPDDDSYRRICLKIAISLIIVGVIMSFIINMID